MRYLFFCSALIFLYGCNNTDNKNNRTLDFKPNIIYDREGEYYSKKLKIFVNVKEIGNLVTFKILDKNRIQIFNVQEPTISKYHNWCFLLDKKDNIWIWSSDVGLYTLSKTFHYQYLSCFGMMTKENIKDIPTKIIERLPKSVSE